MLWRQDCQTLTLHDSSDKAQATLHAGVFTEAVDAADTVLMAIKTHNAAAECVLSLTRPSFTVAEYPGTQLYFLSKHRNHLGTLTPEACRKALGKAKRGEAQVDWYGTRDR